MEHLYMGNPVITMADRPSVGRVGNHYLNGINHLEWVAKKPLRILHWRYFCLARPDFLVLSRG